MYLPIKLLPSLLEQYRIASHSSLVSFQIAEIDTPCSRNTYPVYPTMSYGALPETFQKFLKFGLRIQYTVHTSHP